MHRWSGRAWWRRVGLPSSFQKRPLWLSSLQLHAFCLFFSNIYSEMRPCHHSLIYFTAVHLEDCLLNGSVGLLQSEVLSCKGAIRHVCEVLSVCLWPGGLFSDFIGPKTSFFLTDAEWLLDLRSCCLINERFCYDEDELLEFFSVQTWKKVAFFSEF